MGIDTTKASDHPSTNALDGVEVDLLSTPPAYYAFSQTPAAIEDPLSEGDTATLCMRVKCTGEHGPVARKDGEKRYKRDLVVQAIWVMGEPEPPNADAEQPALFDEDGSPQDEDWDNTDAPEQAGRYEPSGLDEFDPEFSEGGNR